MESLRLVADTNVDGRMGRVVATVSFLKISSDHLSFTSK